MSERRRTWAASRLGVEAWPRTTFVSATIPADKKLHQRQTEATDEEIGALVYESYGLTEEEIGIVQSRGD